MSKHKLSNQTFVYPMAQTILGTHIDGKPNYMALGWLTRVNASPPMLGVGVNKINRSHDAIVETGEFSVNFPSVEMVTVTDYTGIVSAKKVDKSKLFEVFYGELKSAPLIQSCPLTLACKLFKHVELPTNSFFIGEIVGVFTEEKYMTDKKIDIKKLNPFLLTMPDNRYWSVGECVGHAWKDGKEMK